MVIFGLVKKMIEILVNKIFFKLLKFSYYLFLEFFIVKNEIF